jgi:hypothetical protein
MCICDTHPLYVLNEFDVHVFCTQSMNGAGLLLHPMSILVFMGPHIRIEMNCSVPTHVQPTVAQMILFESELGWPAIAINNSGPS